eukprot:4559-Heterococcus_DN1.PRE.2
MRAPGVAAGTGSGAGAGSGAIGTGVSLGVCGGSTGGSAGTGSAAVCAVIALVGTMAIPSLPLLPIPLPLPLPPLPLGGSPLALVMGGCSTTIATGAGVLTAIGVTATGASVAAGGTGPTGAILYRNEYIIVTHIMLCLRACTIGQASNNCTGSQQQQAASAYTEDDTILLEHTN